MVAIRLDGLNLTLVILPTLFKILNFIMIEPNEFYTQEKNKYEKSLAGLKKRLILSSMIRFLTFLTICGMVYVVFGDWKLMLGTLLLGAIVFLYLVVRHNSLEYKRDLTKALLKINNTELKVLKREYDHLPTGDDYYDSAHFYSQDIDLFGKGSFFQFINRTALYSGANKLAKLLTENDTNDIPLKQEAIQELNNLPVWRQNFSAVASLVKTEVSEQKVSQWLNEYKPFININMKVLSILFSLISLALCALAFFKIIHGGIVMGWFVLGLLIVGIYTKKINTLASKTSKIQSTFNQYSKLLQQIENQNFTNKLLQQNKEKVVNEEKSSSQILRTFANYLNALDQRNNVFVGIFLNGLFLRDLRIVHQIEKWISRHKNDVSTWFESIHFFDAYNSLGNFAFNHPKYNYAKIVNNEIALHSIKTGHPLLDSNSVVLNDIQINKEDFFIITGANMAGKSTFLRSIALQIVMNNLGLPVCAKDTSYAPVKLITSMRTTDSLVDDESYFFSELKRLKFIIDEIEKDNYFIILDEILKGTNSIDKAKGSRKFIDKLVRSKSTGMVATHDLSLCKAADELTQVENHYFDAQIKNDELYFDYLFKKGVCKNMNASFLLKKMEIID